MILIEYILKNHSKFLIKYHIILGTWIQSCQPFQGYSQLTLCVHGATFQEKGTS